MRFLICIALTLSSLTLSFSQSTYKYKFNSPNYKGDTLLIAYYYGDRQLIKDTIYRSKDNDYILTGTDTLGKGVYLGLIKPSNNLFQFLISDEKEFTVTFDTTNLSKLESAGSLENKVFYDYLNYISEKRVEIEAINKVIAEAKKDSLNPKDVTAQYSRIEEVDKEVKAYQKMVQEKYSKTITSFLIKASNDDVVFPKEFDGLPEKELQEKRYWYYRNHYFDNTDFDNPALIYNGFFFNRIDQYFTRLIPQMPDTIMKEVDNLLSKMEKNTDAHRFFLSHWLNKYGAAKYIGHDAVYVHLIDNYFKKGKAPWADPEKMHSLYKYADDWRPVLIGKKFPNISTYARDSTLKQIYSIKSPYTLVVFWASDCGHCKKSIPFLVEWEEKYRHLGIKVFTVCTNAYDKEKECWPAVEEKKMTNFINTSDYYQGYRKLIAIPSTPAIFLLDTDKKILIKNFDAEKINEVFEEILKEKNKATN